MQQKTFHHSPLSTNSDLSQQNSCFVIFWQEGVIFSSTTALFSSNSQHLIQRVNLSNDMLKFFKFCALFAIKEKMGILHQDDHYSLLSSCVLFIVKWFLCPRFKQNCVLSTKNTLASISYHTYNRVSYDPCSYFIYNFTYI